MRILSLLPAFILATQAAAAQENAVILYDNEVFVMKDISAGTLRVSRSVLVNNSQGLGEATFNLYTDKDQYLSQFSGTVAPAGGKAEKIGKGDLVTISIAEGLAGDGYIAAFRPSQAKYPFTVTYDYTVQYRKGFAVFPVYYPVRDEKARLIEGRYSIQVPSGAVIRHYSHSIPPPSVSTSDDGSCYTWKLKDYQGYVKEQVMPPPSSFLPLVLASPEEFMFDRTIGRQSTWKELGEWQFSLLQGTDDLPDEVAAAITDLTRNCKSDLEKIQVVYDYLREKTRYVSIQFGIGGFKPFSASQVYKTGFGDCKALSNYMRCLLKAAGIYSEYAVLNTDQRQFIPSYSSFGQTDHVMLAVPTGRDTLWLECTNPILPIRYRHSGIAGHDVLLIREDGGQVVRVPTYPDSLSIKETIMQINLKADGGAHAEVFRRLTLDNAESWAKLAEEKAERRQKILLGGLDVQPQDFSLESIYDNFGDIPECPEVSARFSFNVRSYSHVTGERLIVTVNPYSKRMTFQRGERKNPIYTESGSFIRDSIVFRLPEGYVVESVPQDVRNDYDWGTFSSTCRINEGTVSIFQEVHLKACLEPASRYGEYRDFVRSVNKAYTASFVLKKE